MGAHEWPESSTVAEKLFAEGHKFEFSHAVRLLEILSGATPGLGTQSDPTREALRIRSEMSLSFPSSALKEVRPGEREGDNAEMEITFLGLAGVLGLLPYAFTEEPVYAGARVTSRFVISRQVQSSPCEYFASDSADKPTPFARGAGH